MDGLVGIEKRLSSRIASLTEERTESRADKDTLAKRVEELTESLCVARETVAAFQTASGLCVPAEEKGGDPGGVEPHHVEEYVHALAERVEELEDMLAPWGLLVAQRVERLTLGGVDREHDREENRAMDAVRAEAVEIATKRREVK